MPIHVLNSHKGNKKKKHKGMKFKFSEPEKRTPEAITKAAKKDKKRLKRKVLKRAAKRLGTTKGRYKLLKE